MRRIAVACAVAGAAACAPVGPDYRRPDLDVPKAYAESQPGGVALPAVPADWWRLYQDATLDRLVDAGFTQGSDVRLAIARIPEVDELEHLALPRGLAAPRLVASIADVPNVGDVRGTD